MSDQTQQDGHSSGFSVEKTILHTLGEEIRNTDIVEESPEMQVDFKLLALNYEQSVKIQWFKAGRGDENKLWKEINQLQGQIIYHKNSL